jgi:hypothetical protein
MSQADISSHELPWVDFTDPEPNSDPVLGSLPSVDHDFEALFASSVTRLPEAVINYQPYPSADSLSADDCLSLLSADVDPEPRSHLPQPSPCGALSAEAGEMGVTDPTQLLQQLWNSNCSLLDRIAELEALIETPQSLSTVSEDPLFGWIDPQLPGLRADDNPDRFSTSAPSFAESLGIVHQTAQHQQDLILAITGLFEGNQERISQLERSCAEHQRRFDEQMQHYHQAENTCHELTNRLQRQQRHNLQLKAALEKCLDKPGEWSEEDTFPQTLVMPQATTSGQLLSPPISPVQPWVVPPQTVVPIVEDYTSATPVEIGQSIPSIHEQPTLELDPVIRSVLGNDRPSGLQESEFCSSEIVTASQESEPEAVSPVTPKKPLCLPNLPRPGYSPMGSVSHEQPSQALSQFKTKEQWHDQLALEPSDPSLSQPAATQTVTPNLSSLLIDRQRFVRGRQSGGVELPQFLGSRH